MRSLRALCVLAVVQGGASLLVAACGVNATGTNGGTTDDGGASAPSSTAPGEDATSPAADSSAIAEGTDGNPGIVSDEDAPMADDAEVFTEDANPTRVDSGHEADAATPLDASDASLAHDAGVLDSATEPGSLDAGKDADILDATIAVDAALPIDAGLHFDASHPFDADLPIDANLPADASLPFDADVAFDASPDGPFAACNDCLQTVCDPAITACTSDPYCTALFECSVTAGCLAAGEQNTTCLAACITDAGLTPKETAEAINLLEGLAACTQCTSACVPDSGK